MAKYEYSDLPERLIDSLVAEDLSMVICIPCYNEDHVIEAVASVLMCEVPHGHSIEIIILINASDDAPTDTHLRNESAYAAIDKMIVPVEFAVHPICISKIPKKKSGVGRARKLAMDEAARRLAESKSKLSIITCFDADCSCDENYITALIDHFKSSDKEATSIHFEHPEALLHGSKTAHAIYLYELHLRYFIQYQKLIGLPFAFQTVGSSMACRLSGYYRIGGMNTRQAGEDFYFMHKFIKDDQCDRLHMTTVYPSARVSDRVPFGTGRAVGDMLQAAEPYRTYHPFSFEAIECVVKSVNQLYDAEVSCSISDTYDKKIKEYLQGIEFDKKVDSIRANTRTLASFKKSFYQFFDAFVFMKYLHYMRDHHYPDIEVMTAAQSLSSKLNLSNREPSTLLDVYRSRSKLIHLY